MSAQTIHSLYVRKMYVAACGALIAAAATVLFCVNPAKTGFFPGCPFHVLTGLYCPGCGSSRALHQLLHGNLRAAFGLNPLMVLSLPFLGAYFIWYAAAALQGKPWHGFFVRPVWIWAIFWVILAYGILRNIPCEPFSWLAP